MSSPSKATQVFARTQTYVPNLLVINLRLELAVADMGTRKVKWNALTPEIKYQLWQDKMQQVLSLNWTPRQMEFLLYYANTYLKPEFFTEDSKLFEEFNAVQAEFRQKGSELFGDRGMSIIFGNMDNVLLAQNVAIEGREATGIQQSNYPTCECSTYSSYCMNGIFRPCTGWHCAQGRGCGTWWQYWCNGMCTWRSWS